MTRPATVIRLIVLALVAAAAVACGADQPVGSPTPVPSGVVLISASEFTFEPASLTVPAGTVTLGVRTTGNIEHELRLFDGDQQVGEVRGVAPGQTKDLTVTLEPGEYTYVCKLAGHEEQGMKGTLTVTGG